MPMQSQTQNNAVSHEPPALIAVKAPRRPKRGWLIAGAVLLVFAGILVYGIYARLSTAATVRAETAQMALPSVSVVSPQRSAPSEEIVLPGNVQPFVSAPRLTHPKSTSNWSSRAAISRRPRPTSSWRRSQKTAIRVCWQRMRWRNKTLITPWALTMRT